MQICPSWLEKIPVTNDEFTLTELGMCIRDDVNKSKNEKITLEKYESISDNM